jgi:hypothetical protein
LKSARQKAGGRVSKQRFKHKVAELQTADFIVFPTDIATDRGCDVNAAMFDELDAQVLRRELRKSAATGAEYVLDADDLIAAAEALGNENEDEDECTSTVIEYWEPGARRIRANKAAALRMARRRKNKNDASA